MASLDFIILKINNNDISQMPKNEAVQMFLYSDDPLLLEVRRKHPTLSSDFAHSQNIISSKLENLNISNNDTNNLEIENDLVVTLSSIRSNSTNENMTKASMSKTTQTDGGGYIYALDHHLTKENAERVVEQEHNLFEQCLESEIDIEEITLRKTNSNESLGLTVCYSSMYSSNNNNNNNSTLTVAALDDIELCTDVYISDIQADSVAGRDGRLRQGDQILQINGKDIKNKDETEALIAENNNAVTFLVSRYLFVDEDDFNDPCCIVELNENVCIEDDVGDDDDDVDDDDGDLDYDTQNYLSYENGFVLNNSTKPLAETINLTKSNDVTKDGSFSGDIQKQISSKPAKAISKGCTFPTKHPTTASKQHSSINENNDIKVKTLNKHTNGDNLTKPKGDAHKNTPPSPCIVSHGKLSAPAKQKIAKPGLDYDVEHIYETIPEDSESEPFYCSPYETSMYLTAMGSCSSGAPDSLQVQNQKQRVAQWLGIKSNAFGSPSQRHIQRAGTGSNVRGETLRSAFTVATSGSSSSGGGAANGSTAIGTLFQEDHENSSSAYNTGGSNNSATKPGISSQQTQNCDAKRTCERFPNSREKDSEVFENYHNDKTMLINDSSLAQNNMFQKHFSFKQNPAQHQQGIKQSDQFNAPNLSQYHFVSSQEVSAISTNAAVNIPKNSTQKTDDQMVWKVKRRPDGTRYIVRRPARKYLLKERNLHIAAAAAHITHDTTTEDDTISEVKIGRYWPKEERKKHIERAKERRLQQYQHQNEITRTLKSASFSLGGGNAEKPTQKFQTQQQLRHVRQHDVESRLLQDHHHRQQQKYFQLQFNSVHSCVESASKKPCELLSEDFDDQNKYLPTTSKAIGLDAAAAHFNSSTTLPVSATAKTEKPQTEKALNSAGFRTIAMLDHEENSKLSNEIDKTTNLFSISS